MGYEKVAIPAKECAMPLYEQYREEFPVTRQLTYLNHAAVAPLCRPAAEAMKRLADDACEFGSLHYDEWLKAYEGLRSVAARLINAAPDEIAIIKNTSEGISTVACGLDWNPGDCVIAFREEFPSNYYPWLRLEKRGVNVTWLSIYDPLERIEEAASGARLLAISYVNYLSGHRVDLKSIGEVCKRHGCFFFVDAIQGMGAFPIDVAACHIDGLAADGHKWMLGTEGCGVLYVRREWLNILEPTEFGWMNPANFADYSSRDMTLKPDAGRYECGTLNTVGCYALRAALEFLLSIGIERVADAVLMAADRFALGIQARGCELITERTAETGSGIVTFRHPDMDARQIVSDLKRGRILAASRQGWVRVSPHFYVSSDAIDHALHMVPAA
jgi:cysteine desulfurase/selenocysteine lyase